MHLFGSFIDLLARKDFLFSLRALSVSRLPALNDIRPPPEPMSFSKSIVFIRFKKFFWRSRTGAPPSLSCQMGKEPSYEHTRDSGKLRLSR